MRKKAQTIGWCLVLAACLAGAGSCRKHNTAPPPPVDSTYYGRIKFILQGNAAYSQFTQALKLDSLLDTLASPGPFTLILPGDNPYSRSDVGSYIYEASADQVLKYQILKGTIRFDSLPVKPDQPFPTLLGTNVFVSKYIVTNGNTSDTIITVNGEQITQADVPAANGLIQILQPIGYSAFCVLPLVYNNLEDELNSRPDIRLMSVIFQRLNLWSLLQGTGPYTLFCPTNSAFAGNTTLQLQTVEDVYAADSTQLANFVKNSIIPGRYFLSDFYYNYLAMRDSVYPTLGGQSITASFPPNNFPAGTFSYGFSGQGNSNPVTLNPSNNYIDINGEPVSNAVMIITNDVILPQ